MPRNASPCGSPRRPRLSPFARHFTPPLLGTLGPWHSDESGRARRDGRRGLVGDPAPGRFGSERGGGAGDFTTPNSGPPVHALVAATPVTPATHRPAARTALPSLDSVATDPALAAALPRHVVAALLARLTVAQSSLINRLVDLTLSNDRRDRGDPAPHEAWLTIADVAARLRFAKSYCYELARRGDLPTLRQGKAIRVRLSDLQAWEARLANPAGQ